MSLEQFYKDTPLSRESIEYKNYIERNREYISPAKEGIALIASSGMVDTVHQDGRSEKEFFNNLIKSGMNVAMFGSSFAANHNAITVLEGISASKSLPANQVNCLITNPSLDNKINSYYYPLRLGKYQNLGGWELKDEPQYEDFKLLKESYERLIQIDPSHLVFIDLLGWPKDYVDPGIEPNTLKALDTPKDDPEEEPKEEDNTYKDRVEYYLQTFQKYFHPSLWPYNMYPIGYAFDKIDTNTNTYTDSKYSDYIGDTETDSSDNWYARFAQEKNSNGIINPSFDTRMWLYDKLVKCAGKLDSDNKVFYWDLELFSRMAYLTGRPFYAYCDTMTYWDVNEHYMRPRPTINYLRFEAFSALGYGAKGIVFWTYCMRVQITICEIGQDKDCTSEVLLTAITDTNGKIERLADLKDSTTEENTDTYDNVKQLISEIKKYEDVFKDTTLVKCVHWFGRSEEELNTIPGLTISDSVGALGKLDIVFWPHPEDHEINGMSVKVNSKRKGVMMAHLRNEERNYIVIVNHDPFVYQTLRLAFQHDGTIKELTPYGDEDYLNSVPKEIISPNKNFVSIIQRRIEAGSYLIYEYED